MASRRRMAKRQNKHRQQRNEWTKWLGLSVNVAIVVICVVWMIHSRNEEAIVAVLTGFTGLAGRLPYR